MTIVFIANSNSATSDNRDFSRSEEKIDMKECDGDGIGDDKWEMLKFNKKMLLYEQMPYTHLSLFNWLVEYKLRGYPIQN